MKLSDYAAFMVKARTRATLKEPLAILAVAVIWLAVLGNVAGAALVFSLAEARTTSQLLEPLSIGVGALVGFLVAFFPVYRPPSDPIPALYPIPARQRAFAGYLWDLVRVPPIGLTAFFLLAAPFATTPWQYALSGIGAVVATVAIQRSAGLLLEHPHARSLVQIGLTAALFGGAAAIAVETVSSRSVLAWWAVAILGTTHHLWLAVRVVGAEADVGVDSRDGASSRAHAPFRRLRTSWFRMPMMRTGVLFALGMKVPVLLILGSRMNAPWAPAWMPVVVLAMAAPFPLFSSVFNNAFGPQPGLVTTLHVTAASWRYIGAVYLTMLVGPALMDLVLTTGIALGLGWMSLSFALYYCGALLLLTALGFLSSLGDPRRISGAWMLRSTTSPWITLMISMPLTLACAWLFRAGMAPVVAAAGVLAMIGAGLIGRHNSSTAIARAYGSAL